MVTFFWGCQLSTPADIKGNPSAGVHRHGDDAIPSPERHGGADRAAGARVRAVRSLQQGERAALSRLQREDGPRVRLELSHLAHERRTAEVTSRL